MRTSFLQSKKGFVYPLRRSTSSLVRRSKRISSQSEHLHTFLFGWCVQFHFTRALLCLHLLCQRVMFAPPLRCELGSHFKRIRRRVYSPAASAGILLQRSKIPPLRQKRPFLNGLFSFCGGGRRGSHLAKPLRHIYYR